MPVETTVRTEWAACIRQLMGDKNPATFAADVAASETYVRKWLNGVVPTEAMVSQIATRLGVDLHMLRIAAGYEESNDPIERVEGALRGIYSNATIEIAKPLIREMIKELEEVKRSEQDVTP